MLPQTLVNLRPGSIAIRKVEAALGNAGKAAVADTEEILGHEWMALSGFIAATY